MASSSPGNIVSGHEQDLYEELRRPAGIIGGSFGLVAVALSLFLIFQHLRSYTNPQEQTWIVAVLFMVPVYATESVRFYLFRFHLWEQYWPISLGGEAKVVEILKNESRKRLGKPLLEETDENQGHAQSSSFFSFFFRPFAIGRDLFTIERFGLVQYMILKTVCALLALLLELFGGYGDGEFKWYDGYPYLAVVLNFSQMWALYCLVQFYDVLHEKLKPIRPLAKFISFKAIVFAICWQGVGTALLCAFRVLPNDGKFRTGLQDFLICIEKFLFPWLGRWPLQLWLTYLYFGRTLSVCSCSWVYSQLTTATTKQELKLEKGDHDEPAVLEKTKAKVEAPGRSVSPLTARLRSYSVIKRFNLCDLFIHINLPKQAKEDVVLTINQAIEPVEKGVNEDPGEIPQDISGCRSRERV